MSPSHSPGTVGGTLGDVGMGKRRSLPREGALVSRETTTQVTQLLDGVGSCGRCLSVQSLELAWPSSTSLVTSGTNLSASVLLSVKQE